MSTYPSTAETRSRTGGAHALYLSGAPRLSTKATTESLGPRSHILGVIRALESMGVQVDRVITGDGVPEAMHSGGSEARMGSSRPRLAAADAARLVYRAKSRRAVARVARGKKYSFVYERYALMQELGSVVRDLNTPWVLEVNALLAIEATTERKATSSRRLAAGFERRTLNSADLIVAVTDQLADAITAEYGVSRDKVITIENGVDTAGHTPSSGDPQDSPTLGFLGSLYSWQRLDELITAMSAPENASWRLRIAGTGAELASLNSQVDRLGIADRVDFVGRVHPDDISEFLATVDVCYAGHGSANGVYFSPLKLWEYLAAGRPVLASEHDATRALEAAQFPVRCFSRERDLSSVLSACLAERESLLIQAKDTQPQVWKDYSWAARIAPLMTRLGVPT